MPIIAVDVDRVTAALKQATLKGKKTMTVVVGYEMPYAMYVHEDLTKHHPIGQAKYLEQPARQLGQAMRDAVTKALKQKKSLEIGLTNAGNVLLQGSLPLVPVDTGALKNSHFLEIEK